MCLLNENNKNLVSPKVNTSDGVLIWASTQLYFYWVSTVGTQIIIRHSLTSRTLGFDPSSLGAYPGGVTNRHKPIFESSHNKSSKAVRRAFDDSIGM